MINAKANMRRIDDDYKKRSATFDYRIARIKVRLHPLLCFAPFAGLGGYEVK